MGREDPSGTRAGAVDIALLGPVTVRVDGAAVPIAGRRVPALLSSLAARVPRAVRVDVLVEELYGDAAPADPQNGVQIHVSTLRRLLAGAGADPSLVVTTPTGYRLAIDPDAIDTHRLELAVERGRSALQDRTAMREAGELLDRSLPGPGVEPLADLEHGDAVEGERQRLRELIVTGRVLRAQLHIAVGRLEEATGHLHRLAAEEPLHEQVHELLALALYRSGRQAEALRVLTHVRRVLRDELGIEPSAAIRDLEDQILRQDPSLIPQMPRATVVEVPRPTRLPMPRTTLIGREHEVALVTDLLGEHRMVTIVGPPGVGKSRIALAAVQASGRPARYVDVAGCGDEDALARTLASTFDVIDDERGLVDTLDAVAAVAPDGLVLLDTCEHLVDAAAFAVDRLVRSCEHLTVLVTSRCPLDVEGEQRFAVPPLSIDDAVDLFVVRARAVDAAFRLDADVEPEVRALCTALDGLPLAVELAAGRIDLLGVAGIRRHLDDRLMLLRSTARYVAPRLGSLEAAVAWTWDLLEPSSRAALTRLAAVPLAVPLELATELAAGRQRETRRGIEVLGSLVRQSAVTALGDGDMRVLDSVRAFASVHGPAGAGDDAAEIVLRWLDHATDEVRASLSDHPDETMERLRRTAPLVRHAIDTAFGSDELVAVRACSRLAWFWPILGSHVDGRRWLDRALASPSTTPIERISLLVGAGVLAAAHGEHRAGWRHLARAVVAADPLGFDSLATFAAAHQASMDWALRARPDTAGHERWPTAFAALLAARRRCDDDDPDGALAALAGLDDTVAALLDPVLAGMADDVRGRCLLRRGDPVAALTSAGSAHDAFALHDFPLGVACASLTIAAAHQLIGNDDRAADAAHRAVETYRRLGMSSTTQRLEATFGAVTAVA